MKLKIRKGATVEVIAGSEKGKKGTVLAIDTNKTNKLRIKVQGVRIQTKNDRKDGFVKREGYMDYSNVKLVENATPAKKKAPKKAAKAN